MEGGREADTATRKSGLSETERSSKAQTPATDYRGEGASIRQKPTRGGDPAWEGGGSAAGAGVGHRGERAAPPRIPARNRLAWAGCVCGGDGYRVQDAGGGGGWRAAGPGLGRARWTWPQASGFCGRVRRAAGE